MRILTILFYLFLSASTFAQSNDTAYKDTSKRLIIRDFVIKPDKPLIVIDGIIYNGDLKKINPKDILRVDVLKPPGATNIYGDRAREGRKWRWHASTCGSQPFECSFCWR